jgi:hypothetical protein
MCNVDSQHNPGAAACRNFARSISLCGVRINIVDDTRTIVRSTKRSTITAEWETLSPTCHQSDCKYLKTSEGGENDSFVKPLYLTSL